MAKPSLYFVTLTLFTFFITLTPISSEVSNSFNRTCSKSSDCQFKNKRATQQLDCENQLCKCILDPNIADAQSWDPQWNAESKECKVIGGGPCGDADGLKLTCKTGTGLECLEDRCRHPGSLRKGGANTSCDDEIDCQEGLECNFVNPSKPFASSRACMKNGTSHSAASPSSYHHYHYYYLANSVISYLSYLALLNLN